MKKADLLRMLADEYEKTVRLPDDISLKDYKDAIKRKTGLEISDRRATRCLNEMIGRGVFSESLLVTDRGKNVRVWRKIKPNRRKRVKKA